MASSVRLIRRSTPRPRAKSRSDVPTSRHGVNRSMTAIISSDSSASCAAAVAAPCASAKAISSASCRTRGGSATQDCSKNPGAPLAVQLRRKRPSQSGSIYNANMMVRGRAASWA